MKPEERNAETQKDRSRRKRTRNIKIKWYHLTKHFDALEEKSNGDETYKRRKLKEELEESCQESSLPKTQISDKFALKEESQKCCSDSGTAHRSGFGKLEGLEKNLIAKTSFKSMTNNQPNTLDVSSDDWAPIQNIFSGNKKWVPLFLSQFNLTQF